MRVLPPTRIPSQQRLHLTQDGSWKRCRAQSEATCRVKSGQHRSEPTDLVQDRAVRQVEREGRTKMAELEQHFTPTQIFDAKYEYALDFVNRRWFNYGGDFALRSTDEELLEVFRGQFPTLLKEGEVTDRAVERFRSKLYDLSYAANPEEMRGYSFDRAQAEVREILEGALEIEQGVANSYSPGERAYEIALNLPDRQPDLLEESAKFMTQFTKADYEAWAAESI